MVERRGLKRRQRAKGLGCYHRERPLEVPILDEEVDLQLMKRLINREIPQDPDIPWSEDTCTICYGNHWYSKCPCLSRIAEDVVISSSYDKVCLGCGTIGLDCCGEGTYAVQKRCSFCMYRGHWFWEELCEDFHLGHETRFLWNSVKDGNPLPKRPLVVPNFRKTTHMGELRRLMMRKEIPRGPVDDGCCIVCYEEGHLDHRCPYLRSLPEGKVVGPDFDEACRGCGKIGLRCCDMGACAVAKCCRFCQVNGHWFWEAKCTNCRPEWVSLKNSLTLKELSIEDSLPHTSSSTTKYSNKHLFTTLVKDGHPLPSPPPKVPEIPIHPILIKDFLRLAERWSSRTPVDFADDGYCRVCFDKGHRGYECPSLQCLREGV